MIEGTGVPRKNRGDVIELAATFEESGCENAAMHVGDRRALALRLHNVGDDIMQETLLQIEPAAGVLVISTSPYRRSQGELLFGLPPLLRQETLTLRCEVYALAAGEHPIVFRLHARGLARELRATCIVAGRAAFDPTANRLELFADEADAGTQIEGRVVLTNTGSATATIDRLRISGDCEVALEAVPSTLSPQERWVVRLAATLPLRLADRTELELCASATVDGSELVLGAARVVARSRPHLVLTNDGGAAARGIAISLAGRPLVSIEELAAGESVAIDCSATQTAEPRRPTELRRSANAMLGPQLQKHVGALDGLMRHLWALAVLCADRSQDPQTDENLAAARTALRSVFDRLTIKLRLAHYRLSAEDVLDAAALDAILALDGEAGSSIGCALAAVATLIAPHCGEDGEKGEGVAAAAAYRSALADVLRSYDDAQLLDALVIPHHALDEHLDALLAAELRGVAA